MLSCLTAASGPAGGQTHPFPMHTPHHLCSAKCQHQAQVMQGLPHPAEQSRSQQELLCQPELCSAPAEGIAVQGSMEMQCLEGLSIPVSPPSSGVEHFISMEHPTKRICLSHSCIPPAPAPTPTFSAVAAAPPARSQTSPPTCYLTHLWQGFSRSHHEQIPVFSQHN